MGAYASALLFAILVSPLATGFAQRDDLELASRVGAAGAAGLGASFSPSLSEDGHYVSFDTFALNFDPSDADFIEDVYRRDRLTGTMTLVSRADGPAGVKGNGHSFIASTSCDGRRVAFTSAASNLDPADSDTTFDVYARDVDTNTTWLVSRASGTGGVAADGDARLAMVSCDGHYVTFASNASNLDPADTDTASDIFVRDLEASTTTLVSRATGVAGASGDGASVGPAISEDGLQVAFSSTSTNFDADDSDAVEDVYVRDLESSTTTLVSRATTAAGAKGSAASSSPWISRDGRYVAFTSAAPNLDPDDGDAIDDIFVRDVQANTTTLASRATGETGAKGNAASSVPQIALDGRYVAFYAESTNLDEDDPDATVDAYVRDLESATTTLVSRAAGAAGAKGDGPSQYPAVSADGRFVAFESKASNLDPADELTGSDIFVRDVLGGPPPPPPPPAPAPPPAPPPASPPPPPPPEPSGSTPATETGTQAPTGTPGSTTTTPAGSRTGQPRDSDGDGIGDARDKCPHESSKGRDGNRNGCLDFRRVEGRFLLVPDRYLRFPFRDPVRDILGIKVRSLVGTRLTKGAVVELTCSRRACRRERIKVGAKRRVSFSHIAGRKLRTGTRILIRATLKGAVGLGTQYVVKRNAFSKHRFCIRPATTRAGSCSRVR